MNKVIKIFSENNDFQFLETLRHNRNKRHKANRFVVEGVRAINELVTNNWKLISWIYARGTKLSPWAQKLVNTVSGMYNYELPLELLKKLSTKEETSEIMALVEMKSDNLSQIPLNNPLLVVIFDRPISPGNLGSLIRSAQAFGTDAVIISGHAVDLYDQETINAATGAMFSLPVIRVESSQNLEPWIQETKIKFPNLKIIGGDENTVDQIQSQDLKGPTILILGNETEGLSYAYKQLCQLVSIPTSPNLKSLNVSAAGSVMLYEIVRQRLAH